MFGSDLSNVHCMCHFIQYNKNKTPWRKVKEIIKTHGGSLRNKTRRRSAASREPSPCLDESPCVSLIRWRSVHRQIGKACVFCKSLKELLCLNDCK